MATGIKDLANGNGYIYIVDSAGTTALNSILNNADGFREMNEFVSGAYMLNRNRTAYGIIDIADPGVELNGTVTSITVNSVNQVAGGGAYASDDENHLAKTLADMVNSHEAASGVNYTAKASGSKVYLYAEESSGTSVNGHAIALVVSGDAITTTITNVANGSDASDFYEDYRVYLDADYGTADYSGHGAASIGDLSNAVEITDDIIPKTLISKIHSEAQTMTAGVISPTRKTNISVIVLDTQGAAASDDLDVIEPLGFVDGDIVIMLATATSKVVTVKHGTGNIYLYGSDDWDSPSAGDIYDHWISLQYFDKNFYELDRAENSTTKPTYDIYRKFLVPFMYEGKDTNTLDSDNNQGVFTYEITSGVGNEKKLQEYTASGSTNTMNQNQFIEFKSTDAVDNDLFALYFAHNGYTGDQGNVVVVGSTNRIGGLSFTEQQTQEGGIFIFSIRANNTWNLLALPNFINDYSSPPATPFFELESAFIKDEAVTKAKAESDLRQSLITLQAEVHGSGDYGEYKVYIPYGGTLDEVVSAIADQFSHDMEYDVLLNDKIISQSVTLASASAIGTVATVTLGDTVAVGDILGVRLFIKGGTPATTGKVNLSFKIDRE